ncbi:MAG: hypothetical protein EOM19_04770 [Candidatus Moranbacteria bacterium]|nr:hypothetical protein [Candidatus Moranbacteria bacterium]
MKKFIDSNALFKVLIPVSWKHSLMDSNIHNFQEYEIWKSDAFQISIKDIQRDEDRKRFNEMLKHGSICKIGNQEYFSLPDVVHKEGITKIWTRLFGDKRVLFTLTHLNGGSGEKELGIAPLSQRLRIAKEVISSFELIDRSMSKQVLNSYRFEIFLQGFGASIFMLNKAIENKSFIEAVCILASQIDSSLRIAIILREQILNKNKDIQDKWIYQGEYDGKISERTIYKEARNLEIIDGDIFNKLNELYNHRNRIIHRFIISEITLAEVEEIAFRYYKMRTLLDKIVYNLESEQIKLKVGMTIKEDKGDKSSVKKTLDFTLGKIGKIDYFDDHEYISKDK